MNNYTNECLYKDTYTIINMMDEEMRSKISKKFIEFLANNKDNSFEGTVDSTIPLKQQELRYELRLMLSLIYINYICDDETQKRILAEDEENIRKFYNKNIFENQKSDIKVENVEITEEKIEDSKVKENSLIEYKENFFSKIIKKLKSIFKKKD